MTHRYTLLVGGAILPALADGPATAIAWAEGTILVVGAEAQVRAASRGDSDVVDLRGAFAIPIGPDGEPRWPPGATLEIGGPADFAIVSEDPRTAGLTDSSPIAVVRGGHVVRGRWPSTS